MHIYQDKHGKQSEETEGLPNLKLFGSRSTAKCQQLLSLSEAGYMGTLLVLTVWSVSLPNTSESSLRVRTLVRLPQFP